MPDYTCRDREEQKNQLKPLHVTGIHVKIEKPAISQENKGKKHQFTLFKAL